MSLNLTAEDIGKQFVRRDGKIVTLSENNDAFCKHTHPFVAKARVTDSARSYTSKGHWSSARATRLDLVRRVDDLPPAKANPQNVLRKLPASAVDRKAAPIVTGCLDYFPLALAEVARISKAGNDQHNPGQPLHWARHKSTDHADCIGRHLLERGTLDTDGQRHTAKAAWRVLALLQEELEVAAGWTPAPAEDAVAA